MGEGNQGVTDDWYPLWEAQVDSLRGFTGIDERKKKRVTAGWTNQLTERPTDGQTDKTSFRVAYL